MKGLQTQPAIRTLLPARRWLLCLSGPLLPGMLSGCVDLSPYHIDNCATIPKGAIVPPNGTYVKGFINAQASKAEMDDFVIYSHEWYKGGTELGPYGSYHLGMIVKRLPGVPFVVMLEQEVDPQVNLTRRALIIGRLLAAGIPDAEQRVIVGYPEPKALYGDQTGPIYLRYLISGQGGGYGGGYGGLGGFGGGYGGFGGGYGGFGGGFGGGLGGFGGGLGGIR